MVPTRTGNGHQLVRLRSVPSSEIDVVISRVSQLLAVAGPGRSICQQITNPVRRSCRNGVNPYRSLTRNKKPFSPAGVDQQFGSEGRNSVQKVIREGRRNMADLAAAG